MDDLDLLKQDWNKETSNEFKHYSKEELFLMTKRKSISVVKYLFLFGILEIGVWLIFHYFYHLEYPILRFSIFGSFIILMVFTLNKIRTTKNSNGLMKNILRLRYVILSYTIIIVGTLVYESVVDFNQHVMSFIKGWNDGVNYAQNHECNTEPLEISNGVKLTFLFFNSIYFLIIILVYRMTYGKLKDNYNELNKLENTKNID